jgi:hypothetical protein
VRFARPFTTPEKISTLTKHLEDEKLVTSGRGPGKIFRIETCRAKRVYIPPDHGQPPDVGALKVWISAVPRTGEKIRDILEHGGAWEEHPGSREGNLYLLEDDRHPDAQRYSNMSSYSALSLMIGSLPGRQGIENDVRYFNNVRQPQWGSTFLKGTGKERIKRNFFDPTWVDVAAASKLNPKLKTGVQRAIDEKPTQEMDEAVKPEFKDSPQRDAYQEEVMQNIERDLTFHMYFLVDPAAAFAQIGAQVGPERSIRTLYRVRATFPEYELAINYGQFDVATFGYPIFVAEDTDPM